MSDSTSTSKKQAAKYGIFQGKRYLEMLTTTKESKLTHSQLLVLSLRVYRAKKDQNIPSITWLAKRLGITRKTAGLAVRRLSDLSLWCDNPQEVKPAWFPPPFDDGNPKYYRYYLLSKDSKLSELENRILMMVWSLADGDYVYIRRVMLANLVGTSEKWQRAALNKLAQKGLLKLGASGKTIWLRTPPDLSYWKDKKPKKEKSQWAPSEDWISILVDMHYAADPGGYLVRAISKAVTGMKADYTIKEIHDFWFEVGRIGATYDDLFNYACAYQIHVKDAKAEHAKKGYAKSSIHMLLAMAKRQLAPSVRLFAE